MMDDFNENNKVNNNIKFNNNICAHNINKNLSTFTCFSHSSLKNIAKALNNKYEKKNYNLNDKQILWKQIKDNLYNKCGENETCWIEQSPIKNLNDEQIDEYTFKPLIPKKKYEWLKTSDINNVMTQYQKLINNFLFLGTVPIDFDDIFSEFKKFNVKMLMGNNIKKIGVVFNLDPHYKSGSHWVALFSEFPYTVEYFDSYGDSNDNNGYPPNEVEIFMDRIAKQFTKIGGEKNENNIKLYNKTRHQYANSECGVYCLNFLIERLKGRTFENITNSVVKDEEMNQNRKIFFRE